MPDGRVVTRALRRGYLFPLALAFGWAALVMLVFKGDEWSAWRVGSPLSAATIGAGYLAGLAMFAMALEQGRWVDVRTTVLSSFVLLGLSLGVMWVHRREFHFDGGDAARSLTAWAWLLAHVLALIVGLVLLLWQRRAGRALKAPHPKRVRWATAEPVAWVGVVGTVLGLLVLLTPHPMLPYWPWEANPLDLRMVGVSMLSLGVGSWLALAEAEPARNRVGAVGCIVTGMASLLALLVYPGEVRWHGKFLLIYVAVMFALAVEGLIGWVLGRAGRWTPPG